MSPTFSARALRCLLARAAARFDCLLARAAARFDALLLAACLAAVGCDWREFAEYEDSAQIRVYDAPKNYRLPGYGKVLTSFERGDASVVVASAGADSPVLFQRMWTGKQLGKDAIARCKQDTDCRDASGVGEALIAFPIWAHDTPQQRTGCVLSPGTPKAFVFCDSDNGANTSWDLALGDDEVSTLHFSGVGLPAGHRLGVAILGVYALSDRGQVPTRGRLYYQADFQPPGQPSDDDEVPALAALPLRDPENGEPFAADADAAGDLGYAISAAQDAAGELVIAVSQPSRERVIVATYDESLPGEVADKLRTRACLESPDPALKGFGKRLLVGDINDDGKPEIFVGIDPTDPDSRASGQQAVFMYRGAWLPRAEDALTECPPFEGEPDSVACVSFGASNYPDGGEGSPTCRNSGFGAGLALGDVDGDGVNDLIAGAPYAKVDGSKDAGAVWIIPGRGRQETLDAARTTALDIGPHAGAQLGMSVAALRTKDRHEPVAGAPGEDRLYTFMCSELEGDVSAKRLCLPR
jgi:hypothetical protein